MNPRVSGKNLITATALILVIALTSFTLVRQALANDRLRDNYDALHEQYTELYGEARAAGATPDTLQPDETEEKSGRNLIPVPEPLPSPTPAARAIVPEPGPRGDTGDRGPGPTEAQVRAAVREYCKQDVACDPTDAQINAAVEEYCADDACIGPAGRDGEDGAAGLDGTAGQDATDAQVDAAVQRYCLAQPGGSCVGEDGIDGARGEPGPKGDTGPQGAPGKDGQNFPAIDVSCSEGEALVGFRIDSPSGTTTPYCEPLTSTWFVPIP